MTINASRVTVSDRITNRWWTQPTGSSVAAALVSTAANLETRSWHRRWLNLVCARYMTGRELPSIYGFAMARRPAPAAYMSAVFRSPSFNLIATCADVYSTRIWKNRPFIQNSAMAGNFNARMRARRLSRWNDGMFHELHLWPMVELCGTDAMTSGDGIVKISRGLDKKIAASRVISDELLINEEEGLYGDPRSLIQRVFVHKEELLSRFGKMPGAAAAIEHAQSVFPGFYSQPGIAYSDIVPLVEGWRLPHADGRAGRSVLAIGNFTLSDRKWTRPRFPFAKLSFKPLSLGCWSQGLAEQLLPLQAAINKRMDAIEENTDRVAWPRWLVEQQSKVPDSAFDARSGGIIRYLQTRPEAVAPQPNPSDVYAYLEGLIVKGFKRARISEQAASGVKPAGLNSGAAIMAYAQLDDAAHSDMGQRQEDFVTDIWELLRDEAEEVKPTVTVPGRRGQQIHWDDVRLDKGSYTSRAFPMSRLPQLPAARLQTISDWFADGIIDKETKLRLEQMPDTEGYASLATSPRDYIESVLDELVETGKYTPPDPDMDLSAALQIAQARYFFEALPQQNAPADRLNKLLHWRDAVHELIDEIGGAAPAVGLQSPAGAPAAPPKQPAPAQGPPTPLAAGP